MVEGGTKNADHGSIGTAHQRLRGRPRAKHPKTKGRSILYRPAPDAAPATMTLHPDCAIKYFTAKIIESAAKGEDSVSSQAQYHNALTTHCGSRLSFVMGLGFLHFASMVVI